MKRDPHISKLIRESGVISAPGNFTASVMDKIEADLGEEADILSSDEYLQRTYDDFKEYIEANFK